MLLCEPGYQTTVFPSNMLLCEPGYQTTVFLVTCYVNQDIKLLFS